MLQLFVIYFTDNNDFFYHEIEVPGFCLECEISRKIVFIFVDRENMSK